MAGSPTAHVTASVSDPPPRSARSWPSTIWTRTAVPPFRTYRSCWAFHR